MKKYINKVKQIIKDYWKVVAVLSVCCLVIFFQFLFQHKKYELMNDQVFQFNLFYKEWIRIIKDAIIHKEWPFFSWFNHLGEDYFATKITKGIFDAYFPIIFVLVAVFKKSIEYSTLITTILNVIVSGVTMKFYLRKLKIKNEYISDLGAILYALSGVASLYFCNYFFHRFYGFLPLLFAGIEDYLNENRKCLFIFSVFLLFLQDYYFMFPTSFFMVGYFIASYYTKKKDNIWTILLKALPLIGYYIVGLAMAGVSLIPTVLYITKNTRVGAGTNGLFFDIKIYFNLIASMFVPPYYVNNALPKLFFDGTDGGHITWSSFYATSIVLITLCSVKKIMKTDEIKPFFINYFIYFVFMLIKPFNSIMHGFSNASLRWSFLLIMLGIIIAVLVLDKELIDKNTVRNYLYFLGFIVLFAAVLFVMKEFSFEKQWLPLLVLSLVILLSFIYIALILKKNYILLILLVCIELVIGNTFICRYNSYDFFYYEDSINPEYIDYFLTDNPDNYLRRIYIDSHDIMPAGDLNQNNSLKYEYMGTMCYDSTYDYTIDPFLKYTGLDSRPIDRIIDISDPELLQLLSVRYYGVYNEDKLPYYENGYTYAFDLNAIHMYELNGYNSIGHTYSDFVKVSDFNKDNINWNETLIVDDDDFELVKDIKKTDKKQLEVVEYSNNYFQGKINLDSKEMLFVSLPYSTGWRVFNQNGEKIETMNVEGGFTGIILPEGEHTLYFNFTSPNFKAGVLTSFTGFVMASIIAILDIRKRKVS